MHTNIVFDKTLVNEAFCLSGIKTTQELVNKALKEFIERRSKPLDLRGLKGMGGLCDDYDYKALRVGKVKEAD